MMKKIVRLPARAIGTFQNLGKRPKQEDSVVVDQENGVFIVSDGFGGIVSGGEASQSACALMKNYIVKESSDEESTMPFILRKYFSNSGNVLFNACIYANKKIIKMNKNKNIHERIGASLIAGFVDKNILSIVNVGSCTAWMIRDGKSFELVMPRTLCRFYNPLFRQQNGLSGYSEYNIPLMVLGVSDDLEPEIFEYQIQSGDWVLFYTDGIGTQWIEHLIHIQNQKHLPEKAMNQINEFLKQIPFVDNVATAIAMF